MKIYTSKHIFIISLSLLLGMGIANSQTDPLLGTWKNSYNSELDITFHDPFTGAFYGTYSSSTGATGKYNIIGFSPFVPSKKNADTPKALSLSILWKPLKGATGSADEQWASSMTGQIIMDKSGAWIMEVFHSLNASTPLAAVEIQGAGHYSETLIFKRTTTHSVEPPSPQVRAIQQTLKSQKAMANPPPASTKNPLQGKWVAVSSSTYSSVDITSDVSQNGIFEGIMTQKGGDKITIIGHTTPTAPTGNIQSLSFNFMASFVHGIACYSANGFLYRGNRLELTIAKSKATPYASKYAAVQMTEKVILYRVPSQKNINIAMKKNKFTNNGASEWTANFSVGTAIPFAPVLKFGMDTGGNFSWVNSTQCTTESCTSHGHTQFNPNVSTTFQWIDKTPKKVNWGPWGNATANLGSELISFSSKHTALRYNMKLITYFSKTSQFDEFLWDGAFAFPASSKQMVKPTSNILKTLLDNGQLQPDGGKVCVSFYFNPDNEYGFVSMGEWDSSLVDTSSKLIFKYQPYSTVPYLWCSTLKSFSIGNKQIASGGSYSFDTGSSALKGDSAHMQQTLDYAKQIFVQTGKWPAMRFEMGIDQQGNTGTLELNADQYVQLIEDGEHKGERVPQIQTLSGTPNLYLQGSTMLNYVYSVFWWNVIPNTDGTYDLTAREVWLFNKKDGPQIIQTNRPPVATAPLIQGRRDNGTVYPNPVKNKVSVNVNLHEQSDVFVSVYSLNGEKLYEKRYRQLSRGQNTITLEEVNWKPLDKRMTFAVLIVRNEKKVFLQKKIWLSR